MFTKVLRDLGITEQSVKGAISGLLNSNAQLKDTVRQIVGSGDSQFRSVGTVNGTTLYAKN